MHQYQFHQEWLNKFMQYHILYKTYFQKRIELMGGVCSTVMLEPVGTIQSKEYVNRAKFLELMNDERLSAAYFLGWNDHMQMMLTHSTLMNSLLVSSATGIQHRWEQCPLQNYFADAQPLSAGTCYPILKDSLISPNGDNTIVPSLTAAEPTMSSASVHKVKSIDRFFMINEEEPAEPDGYSIKIQIHKIVLSILQNFIFLRRLRRNGLKF